ncbi:MAG: ChbG/HpnK family deacetylase [Selenomonadaceae bacterium]|nr:ChbG/HpnK family deacetylase [Selenomonadaceae bacterium]
MYQIIVNADDFGRHRLINEAVKKAAETGCLRSATVMPGGIAFDDAIETAKSHPDLGLGIHFTLVNGNPILPPAEIPSLVAENGLFYDNYGLFVKRYAQGKVNMDEVRRELAAQLTKLEATGVSLTHFDSHQHIHSLPGITEIALDIACKAGIKAMRVPATGLFLNGGLGKDRLGSVIGRAGLRFMAVMARQKAKSRGLVTTEYFAGNVAGRAVNLADFSAIIGKLREGTTEIMMHPGTDNTVLQKDCGWEHDFEAELASVCTPPTDKLLKNIRIANFRDLCTARA